MLVNGKGPYAFEIDTSGHLIIGAGLAKAFELEPIGQFAGTRAGTAITQVGIVANQEIRIGEVVDAREAKTIADLIDRYQLLPQSILVERNGLVLHRHEWPERSLAEGDRIEFVRVVADG